VRIGILLRGTRRHARSVRAARPAQPFRTSRCVDRMALTAEAALTEASAAQDTQSDDAWWNTETQSRISAILALLHDYMPWLLPEYAPLRELPELAIKQDAYTLGPDDADRIR